VQVSAQAEEERLGVDFAELWQKRQKAEVEAQVEQYLLTLEGAKAISFQSEYATSCAPSSRLDMRPM
jgi:hypothetical protein